MDYIVHTGRPKDSSGRLEKEMRAYDLLDSLGIEYQRVDHEALETMDACEGVDKAFGVAMCKNLFLCNAQRTKFYLLLMPGYKKFLTKDLSKQIGSARLSFGSAGDMERLMEIAPGSVTVMGLMNDKDHQVQLIIDEELLKEPYMACHPCINTSSIKLRTDDVLKKLLPAIEHEPIFVRL
ncbi:MAG: prolyl-tRNA synthetase associated domain-containing protein [Clostridiales bacterium]|jgi:Ala-tRNA(Pro) deacylase|nr:prolyl-tRNA synthetase associated domain-containing protein [Clostridiales bacterium]